MELRLVVEFHGRMYRQWADNVRTSSEASSETARFERFEGGMMSVGESREGGWLNAEGGVNTDRRTLCERVDDWTSRQYSTTRQVIASW